MQQAFTHRRQARQIAFLPLLALAMLGALTARLITLAATYHAINMVAAAQVLP